MPRRRTAQARLPIVRTVQSSAPAAVCVRAAARHPALHLPALALLCGRELRHGGRADGRGLRARGHLGAGRRDARGGPAAARAGIEELRVLSASLRARPTGTACRGSVRASGSWPARPRFPGRSTDEMEGGTAPTVPLMHDGVKVVEMLQDSSGLEREEPDYAACARPSLAWRPAPSTPVERHGAVLRRLHATEEFLSDPTLVFADGLEGIAGRGLIDARLDGPMEQRRALIAIKRAWRRRTRGRRRTELGPEGAELGSRRVGGVAAADRLRAGARDGGPAARAGEGRLGGRRASAGRGAGHLSPLVPRGREAASAAARAAAPGDGGRRVRRPRSGRGRRGRVGCGSRRRGSETGGAGSRRSPALRGDGHPARVRRRSAAAGLGLSRRRARRSLRAPTRKRRRPAPRGRRGRR